MATTSSVSPLSSAWVQSMVNLTLSTERKPLTTLQSQRDTVEIRKGIYSDISSKVSTLRSSIESLRGDSNAFTKKTVAVNNPSTGDVATAALDGTSAVAGSYTLQVTKLAQAHQIASDKQNSIAAALNLSGTFTIKGVGAKDQDGNYTDITIQMDSGHTLNDIRAAINSKTYADDKQVQATIVDGRLVLTSESTGLASKIKLIDSSYDSGTPQANTGVLKGLGIEVDASGALTETVNGKLVDELQAAQDAQFSVNNISITRSSNKGLTDVVQGLSLDLLKENSSATISVGNDYSSMESQVKSLLDNANSLMKYLKQKMEPTESGKDDKGRPTYSPAAVGQDSSLLLLRQNVASGLLGKYEGAASGAPKYLADLGVSIDSNGLFTLSDSTKLQTALKSNLKGVKDLFDNVLVKLDDRLKDYSSGDNAVLSVRQKSLTDQSKQLTEQIGQYERRLKARETALTSHYSDLQAQIISLTYQYQSFQAGSTYSSSG
ncbi:MAG: flagellar filament capping protein FliD [Anaerolineae bacterium]